MQVFFANRAWLAYAGTAVIQIVPQSIGPVTHKWLNSYNATTGLFTESQPNYSDLTGTPQLANTKAPVSHEWLASYDATTGNFTQSQPSFADISGNLAEAQLPTAGVTHTVTLAALTGLELREALLLPTESQQTSSIRRKLFWRCNRGRTRRRPV